MNKQTDKLDTIAKSQFHDPRASKVFPLRACVLVLPSTGAKPLLIKEQRIEDRGSGLTLVFDALPDGTTRLRICGENLPFGNRDFIFNHEGELAGGGTATI